MATKYKNIVGTGFDPYVKKQLEVRSNAGDPRVGVNAHNVRSNNELQYLTNRNAYFRLSSSTETTNRTAPTLKKASTRFPSTSEVLDGTYNSVFEQNQNNTVNAEKENKEALLDYNNSFTDELARDNVLQGGTIAIGGEKNSDTFIRKGFNETYKIGDGGTDPSDDLGLQPMPGITGITIGTGGKWQTLMQADIEIIAYNLDQLNVIQKLYMSLGVTCFLEWGHTPYLDNDKKLVNEPQFIDFFNYKGSSQKLDLFKSITKKRQDTKGNYDAFLGTVYNFSYDGDRDGAYMCKIQLMGAGGMLESLKINTAYNIDFTNPLTGDRSDKYSSTLDNALASMKDFLQKSNSLSGIDNINDKKTTTFGKIDTSRFFQDQYFTLDNDAEIKSISGGVGLNNPNIDFSTEVNIGKWGDLLNTIYNSTYYSPINFKKDKGTSGKLEFKNDNDPFKYGNAHQVVTGKAEIDGSCININGKLDDLSEITPDLFSGYVGQWGGSDQKEKLTFITLGHLMALINLLGIFVESNNSDGENSSPIIYIDFHPDNTEINQGDLVASVNPHVCLVPFIPYFEYSAYFSPLDINLSQPYKFSAGLSNSEKNLIVNKNLNKINSQYKPEEFAVQEGNPSKGGKLFNTLINIEFARKCLKSTTNAEGNTSLLDFLTKILNGINESLGSVNNLRPFVDECGFILRIVDEKLLEPIIDVKDERLVEIPSFGLDSLVYEGGFSSAITPKLASQIVISTQAVGGGIKEFEEDVLSYQKLNQNVKDRFSSYKFPSINKKSKSVIDSENKQKELENARKLKSLQRLYDQFYYVYSSDPDSSILEKDCRNMVGPFKNIQGKKEKELESNSKSANPNNSSIVIPLQYSITLDGISGILPYNAFLLPPDRLPKNYLNGLEEPRVAFAVFSINHSFENNNWFTTLRGQTILLTGPSKEVVNTEQINAQTKISITPRQGNYSGFPPVSQTSFQTVENSPRGRVTTVNNITPSGINTGINITSTSSTPTVTVNTLPDGRQSISLTPLNPRQSDQDINAAFTFIANEETPGGVPELKAYTDKDYTDAAITDLEVASYPFTYRIGFGSDTVTNTDGSVTKVVRSSRITVEQAELDLKRRINDEFKPRVVRRLNERGVNYDNLPLKVKVVFIDLAYNYGTLFYDFITAYKSKGVQGIIDELNRRIAKGESQVPRRRQAEINYLNG